MMKKLGVVAVLTTLALSLSACLMIHIQKPGGDDKPDHHVSAGQST